MATKIFKRTNARDVFNEVNEQDHRPETEEASDDSETSSDATQLDTIEPSATASDETDEDRGPDDSDDVWEVDDEAPTHSCGRRWLWRTLATTMGIVFVAALGLAGLFGWQVKDQHDTAAAGRAALAAAQSYGVILTSIDTKGIDQNFSRVLDGATGEFKDMYGQSASQLRQVLIDNKAMSKGVVVDSAIKSATKTKVEVLLFIDQTISNSVNPQPRIDRSRVAMTMELIDNRWLASKVDIK